MPTINSTLSLAKGALLTHQGAMGTASDNVANVNTEGFSRRRARMTPSPTITTTEGRFGQGVYIDGIEALRDQFVERQVRDALGDSGWFDAGNQQLMITEEIVSDLSENGLGGALDNFWNAWHELAADPSSMGARNNLRERADALTNHFNRTDEKITDQIQRIDDNIKAKVNRLNAVTRQLADLNVEIGRAQQAADLEDRRGLLIDELSTLADVEYRLEENGAVVVYLDGKALVMHDNVNEVETSGGNGGNPVYLTIPSVSDERVEVNGGEIGALINVRDGEIATLREKLDEIASTLAGQVNEVHRDGYNLNGESNIFFFDPNVSGMGDIRLSTEILNGVENIAASGDGSQGDNSIALRIAELENQNVMENGETIREAYQSTSSWFGTVVSEAQIAYDSSNLSLQQANAWRESVSGVSLDEEMAELIRFQHAFNAAAKVIGGANKMLEAVINIG